jgi:hypothetical protein
MQLVRCTCAPRLPDHVADKGLWYSTPERSMEQQQQRYYNCQANLQCTRALQVRKQRNERSI